MEINLDNPIFVYYFDSGGKSRQHIESLTSSINEHMSKYTNITFWIVPADYTKIECVFDRKSSNDRLNKLKDCLNSIIDDPSLSEFKQKMREILIGDIVNEKD